MRRAQPEARAEFFRRYAPQVRRILFLQGLCDEVDDAVQEVFIKVFRAELPAEERFLAWFYRLILNAGRDQGRRRKTRRGLVERLEELAPAGARARASRPGPATRRCARRWMGSRPTSARRSRCASSPTCRWRASPPRRTCRWAR